MNIPDDLLHVDDLYIGLDGKESYERNVSSS